MVGNLGLPVTKHAPKLALQYNETSFANTFYGKTHIEFFLILFFMPSVLHSRGTYDKKTVRRHQIIVR